ncbi:MAG: 1,4-dihydroxy-2-naphthoate octaprenyltransferase, partial [Flavobacteriales bacterium]|nr:1,4-dihydroxy-2-naphthoate octaprenyltransferase [Flavobacteriales bacterium]
MTGPARFRVWLEAMRLRTLPLASAGIIAGTALAAYRIDINWAIAGLTLFTALCLQILSNFANDLGDFSKGTDNDARQGPTRSLQSGAITARAMTIAVVITAAISLVSGIALLALTFGNIWKNPLAVVLLLIGLGGIGAAIKYTMGKSAFGYRGLGDLAVFIFFGIVAVFGTYLLQIKVVDLFILLPATAIGMFSVAVLNLNNMRDIENDRASGKKTLVVKIGLENAKSYHASLIILGWMMLAIYWFKHYETPVQLILFVPGIIFFKHL